MNKILKYSLLIGLIWLIYELGIVIMDIPISISFNKSYPIATYNINEDFKSQNKIVTLQGKWTNRLLTGDEFNGTIVFLEGEIKKSYDLNLTKFINDDDFTGRFYDETNEETDYFERKPIGGVRVDKNKKNINVWIYDDPDGMMAGPATSLEEALEIYQVMTE